jgi:dTMP kinase
MAMPHPLSTTQSTDVNKRLQQGCLIVFEGIDGSGKTTQIGLLYDRLCQAGYHAVKLKEPTDGYWGQQIRQLFSHGREGISRETELRWFLNDRREHVTNHIRPALKRHDIVLIDRYYFSTMAYQGALGLDIQAIQAQNEAFAPPPDLLLLLDIAPEASMQLVQQRSTPNQFEKLAYLKQVAAVFEQMQFPYMRRIDATQTIDRVHQQIWAEVDPLLRRLQESTS